MKLVFCHLNSNCSSNPPQLPAVFTENTKPYLLPLALRPKTYLTFDISLFLCVLFVWVLLNEILLNCQRPHSAIYTNDTQE